jgi:hypothetical protein
MWKNIVQPDRPQMTIWRMRVACRIPKATNKHSEYVTLYATPLQQWMHERASLLRHTYIACLVITSFSSFLLILLFLFPFAFSLIYSPSVLYACYISFFRTLLHSFLFPSFIPSFLPSSFLFSPHSLIHSHTR